MLKFVVVIVASAMLLADAQPIQKQKLRFKVSAKGLADKDDLGTTDPYVELYYTEGSSDKERKFGRSATLSDTENPNWGDVFEFDYDRSKGQRWLFKVKDHDNLREDDTVGRAWVQVDDYVDRHQQYSVNLVKKGMLTIQTVDPVTQAPQVYLSQGGNIVPAVVQGPQQPQQPLAVQNKQQNPVLIGGNPNNPIIAVPILPETLKFQLSARGLDDLDIIGTTDPYIKAFYTDDVTRLESQFGRTAPISDSENPNFPETFEFQYIRGKKQRWHFQVLDQDDNRRDDEVGDVFLDVDDYVAKGQSATLKLKKGDLIVKRA